MKPPSPEPDLLADALALLQLPLPEFGKACKVTSVTGSGPGGQHRNRKHTGCRAELLNRKLYVVATEFRESARNRQAALLRLRLDLALDAARGFRWPDEGGAADDDHLPRNEGSGPSYDHEQRAVLLQAEFRGRFRPRVSSEHIDYAVLVLTSLLLLARTRGNLRALADLLSVSSSSLVRLWAAQKAVLAEANQIRQDWNLPVLRPS